MRTRPASIATVVIAIGLALTTVGIARSLPYTFGGVGSRTTIGADLWAHGTAVSPALVALFCLGLLAAIAMRPTRGGRRSAAWLALLAATLVMVGLAEPAQQDLLLLGAPDPILTPAVYAFHLGLIALTLSAIGETRRTGLTLATVAPLRPVADAWPAAAPMASAVTPGVPGPAALATAPLRPQGAFAAA